MQELIGLGIDTSKASLFWVESFYFDEKNNYERIITQSVSLIPTTNAIPTFTLQDILEMLPKNIMHSNKQLKTCNYKLCTFDNKVMYTFNSFDQCWLKCTYGKNLLEAAFNMLKWCKQNNYV